MQAIEEIVKIGEKGQITLPAKIVESEDLKEGDFLVVSEVNGIIMIRRVKPEVDALDFFADFGRRIEEAGYDSKEKRRKLVDEIKEEVAKEWSKEQF
jgi:AbrB family looped-hinge helix DNA binding protein